MQELIDNTQALLNSLIEEAKYTNKFISDDKKKAYQYKKEKQFALLMQILAFLSEKEKQIPVLLGQPMPQAIELECGVLGAVLCDSTAFARICGILRPESFYNAANSIIYATMQDMHSKNIPIDLLTISEALKNRLDKVGGVYYITVLANGIGSSANIEFWARIVAQKHIQREIIRECTEAIKASFEDIADPFELLDNVKQIKGYEFMVNKTAAQ